MPAEKYPELVSIGHAAIDVGAHVSAFPRPDTKYTAENLSCQGGGPAATAACTAARLGIKAAFMGAVGDDLQGQLIMEEFLRDGVDISGLAARTGAASPVSIIIVIPPAATRTIIWSRGSADRLAPDEIDSDTIKKARCLLIDGHQMEASIAAAEIARKNGIPVVFDAGSMKPDTEKLLEYVDHLIASNVFAEEYTGEDDPSIALKKMAKQGFKNAAVTMGNEGAFFLRENSIRYQAAFKVNAIDTTGAGDVFHGAYAFALIREYGMKERIEIATAAAAMKCTKPGARAAIPTLNELAEFLRKYDSSTLGRKIQP